jgi:hypothetical protein
MRTKQKGKISEKEVGLVIAGLSLLIIGAFLLVMGLIIPEMTEFINLYTGLNIFLLPMILLIVGGILLLIPFLLKL